MGKIKVGLLDAVFLILILSLLAFFLVINPDPYSFSGAEVYYAISKYKTLDARGFDIGMAVSGKEVSTGQDIYIEGTVAGIDKSSITIDTGERRYSVGGILAGMEDIAASEITLVIRTPSVIQVRHEAMDFRGMDSFCSGMYRFVDSIGKGYGVGSVRLEGTVGINMNLDPAKQVDIANGMSLVQGEELFLYSNGFRIESTSIRLDELCSLGLPIQMGKTNSFLVKIGVLSRLSDEDGQKIKEGLPDGALSDSFRVVTEG
ncbi:MAG: TrmB family transcriptional regulator sugar-binding domain-containing protein [archaeon]